jgi:hypothetical protein
MTTHERIEQQSFRYEPSLPPSVPEGQPLRAARAARRRRERGVLGWLVGRRRTTR